MRLSCIEIQALVVCLTFLISPGLSQTSGNDSADLTAQAAGLYARGDWQQLLSLIPESSSQPPQLDYYRGMALARLGRHIEARQTLERGAAKDPSDKRFPLELAGLAFQSRNYASAKAHLRRALGLDGEDHYAQEFLATIFFLEENWGAALKHWNVAGKPVIEAIGSTPIPRLESGILDQAFRFAPANLLRVEDYGDTCALLDLQGIFPAYRFELLPRADSKFDLQFHPVERNGLGEGVLPALFYVLRGVPAQTVYLDAFNLKSGALNSQSLFRWQPQKRRLFSSLSGIWRGNPQWRYTLLVDWRKENWDLSRTYQGPPLPAAGLLLQSFRGRTGIQKLLSRKWNWRMGIEVAQRRFEGDLVSSGESADLFSNGTTLKYSMNLGYRLLSVPERRFEVLSSTTLEIAKQFGTMPARFATLQQDVKAQWFPRPTGDDDAVMLRFRAGTSLGSLPFDELFMLGMERENDLRLRGHAVSLDGRKGNSYLGRQYLLFNSEFDKRILRQPFLELFLGPFLDVGKTYDKPGRFAAPEWLWDIGVQTKVRLRTGSSVVFSYGKDLQAGQNVFFLEFSR